MLAQLEENLVHLEGGKDGLDQHRRLDGAAGNAERLLRGDEDIVPQPRLEVGFHLRQIEIGAGSRGLQGGRVVEEVEREVEQAGRDRRAVYANVGLGQVPAAWPDQQRRGTVVEAVGLAARGILEGDGAGDGVAQVDLAADHVVPGGRARVLEIGHEHAGAGVERVDYHLALDRPGDFDAAVLEVGGHRSDGPLGGADLGGFGQEVWHFAALDAPLTLGAAFEKGTPLGPESAFQRRHQVERRRRQNLVVAALPPAHDLDAVRRFDRRSIFHGLDRQRYASLFLGDTVC